MKNTTLLTALTATATIAASTAQATVINLPDLIQTPATSASDPDRSLGETVSPNTNGSLSYVVATYTFGENSRAHIRSWFDFTGTQNRLGVEIRDDGVVSFANQGDPGDTTVDLTAGGAGSMAGESVTMIWRSYYHNTNDSLRATNGTSDDMLMNVWVNPTLSSTETAVSPGDASLLNDGDIHTLWNSNSYGFFTMDIQNQTTLAGAGNNTITNVTVLTGADATFANALAIAVPEPGSLALLGLGGVLVAARRRRG